MAMNSTDPIELEETLIKAVAKRDLSAAEQAFEQGVDVNLPHHFASGQQEAKELSDFIADLEALQAKYQRRASSAKERNTDSGLPVRMLEMAVMQTKSMAGSAHWAHLSGSALESDSRARGGMALLHSLIEVLDLDNPKQAQEQIKKRQPLFDLLINNGLKLNDPSNNAASEITYLVGQRNNVGLVAGRPQYQHEAAREAWGNHWVKALLGAGADPSVGVKGEEGKSAKSHPLCRAIVARNHEAARLMVSGRSINDIPPHVQSQALSEALTKISDTKGRRKLKKMNHELADILLNADANPNALVGPENKPAFWSLFDARSSLKPARPSAHRKIIDLLVAHGADLNATDEAGRSLDEELDRVAIDSEWASDVFKELKRASRDFDAAQASADESLVSPNPERKPDQSPR